MMIVANFLHGRNHAVDEVEEMLWSNNEHLMTMIIVTAAIYSQQGEWE